MDPKDVARQKVLSYLAVKKSALGHMSVDWIVWDVRINVPEAKDLGETDLRAQVAVWRSINGPLFPLPVAAPAPTAPESKLLEAAKKLVKSAVEGADVVHGDDGKVNISVTGLTAELQKGGATWSAEAGFGGPKVGVEKPGLGKVQAGISWGGTLGVEAEVGNFHLSGELSKDKWEVKLTYPEDTAIPDLSTLSKVFGEGETAMRKIAAATGEFKNIGDVPKVKAAIEPHLKPAKEALEAVKGVAKAPAKRGVSFGLSAGSPDPLPGQTGIQPGYEIKATVTLVRF